MFFFLFFLSSVCEEIKLHIEQLDFLLLLLFSC